MKKHLTNNKFSQKECAFLAGDSILRKIICLCAHVSLEKLINFICIHITQKKKGGGEEHWTRCFHVYKR